MLFDYRVWGGDKSFHIQRESQESIFPCLSGRFHVKVRNDAGDGLWIHGELVGRRWNLTLDRNTTPSSWAIRTTELPFSDKVSVMTQMVELKCPMVDIFAYSEDSIAYGLDKMAGCCIL